MRVRIVSLLLSAAAVAAAPPRPLGLPEADIAFTSAQYDAAVAHAGTPERLRAVLRRLEAGRPVTLAVLGGSISAGSTLGVHHRNGAWLWHGRLFQWINRTWPHAGHRWFNGAVPASTPAYIDGCLDFHLPRSADLVLIEYTLNTLDWREYERLLRRALAYPRRPAILLISTFKQWSFPHRLGEPPMDDRTAAAAEIRRAGGKARTLPNEPRSSSRQRIGGADGDPTSGGTFSSFDFEPEGAVLLLAQYYGVAALSMRNALFKEVMAGAHLEDASHAWHATRRQDAAGRPLPNGSQLVDFMLDRIHLSGKGHGLVAGLIAAFLRAEAERLPTTREAHGAADMAGIDAAPALPPPLYFSRGSPFELDREALLCVRGRELLKHIANARMEADGWRYTVEGSAFNPKPGLVARESGRTLSICWRPPRPTDPGHAPPTGRRARSMRAKPSQYAFKLGFLKSYGSEYGVALVNCSGTCACEPTWVDSRAGPRDRHRVSLHTVQNIVLSTWSTAGAAAEYSRGCCYVSVTTHLASEMPSHATYLRKAPRTVSPSKKRQGAAAPAASADERAAASHAGDGVLVIGQPMKFKVLSFFVGPTAAGKGRLHQQSIVLSEGVNAADEERADGP
jgi:hypothetical protein